MKEKEKNEILIEYLKKFGAPIPFTMEEPTDEWLLILKQCIEENREWNNKDIGIHSNNKNNKI